MYIIDTVNKSISKHIIQITDKKIDEECNLISTKDAFVRYFSNTFQNFFKNSFKFAGNFVEFCIYLYGRRKFGREKWAKNLGEKVENCGKFFSEMHLLYERKNYEKGNYRK